MSEPIFNQLNIIVDNMGRACDFYRLLGLPVEEECDDDHVEIALPGGFSLELDSHRSVSLWDGSWNESSSGRVVLGFTVPTREDVDALYTRILEAGYRGRQPPYDAFWGSRYAIVEDPNGTGIALKSPVDASRKYWPPKAPPRD